MSSYPLHAIDKVHDKEHDLESFFWVVVIFFFTHDGDGSPINWPAALLKWCYGESWNECGSAKWWHFQTKKKSNKFFNTLPAAWGKDVKQFLSDFTAATVGFGLGPKIHRLSYTEVLETLQKLRAAGYANSTRIG